MQNYLLIIKVSLMQVNRMLSNCYFMIKTQNGVNLLISN